MTNTNRPDGLSENEDKVIGQASTPSETENDLDINQEQIDYNAARRFHNDFYETLESTDQIGDEQLIEEAESDYVSGYNTKSDKDLL